MVYEPGSSGQEVANQFFCEMNQFYLYDKAEAGAYNRARLKLDLRLCRGL
jgi:hypothetical protein